MKTRLSPGLVRNLVAAIAALASVALAQSGSPPSLSPSPSAAGISEERSQVPVTQAPDKSARTPETPGLRQSSAAAGESVRVPERLALSYWTREMLKLARAGIEESVQYSFIDNAAGTFSLGAEQIIYLRDAGISSDVISAMLQHDFEIAEGLRSIPITVTPSSDFTLEFVPARSAPASRPSTPRAGPAAPAPSSGRPDPQPESPPVDELLPLENLELTLHEAEQFENTTRQERQASYAVRMPHPVRVSPPIIIIRASGVQPNVQLLETDL
jgi:hypothetical protein